MKYSYDTEAGALYISLSDGIVAESKTLAAANLVVDVDVQGRPVGIEVIHPLREWPVDELFNLVGDVWRADVAQALEVFGITPGRKYPAALGDSRRSLTAA